MKYCQKCGQQIHDEAVICVHCGCSTEKIIKTNSESLYYYQLEKLKSDANSIFTLGIFSLVLCMGIGLIFQLINMSKLKQYKNENGKWTFPELDLTSQKDIYEYDAAKKKFETGATMTVIGWCITILLLSVLFIILMVSMQI